MAKVYSSQNGVMRGRIGNTVYRKGQASTIAAQYQPQVSNPKSESQRVQRCAFATASAAASALNFIINHSTEGVNGKRENYQKFIKRNVEMLKAAISSNASEGVFNIKGVAGIQPNNYILSVGSVPYVQLTAGAVGDSGIPALFGGIPSAALSNAGEYESALRAMSLIPGDQLSIVMIVNSGQISGQYTGSLDKVYNEMCYVAAARFTFASSDAINFSTPLPLLVGSSFNPALLKRSEGASNFGIAVTDAGALNIYLSNRSDEAVQAAAVVRSQIDENGKFRYSTSRFACTNGTTIPTVVESYGDLTTFADGSSRFLDNATLGN